ncbi:MAG: PQQ-dependent sugar dehydrogenase [Actinomycetota bacterium]
MIGSAGRFVAGLSAVQIVAVFLYGFGATLAVRALALRVNAGFERIARSLLGLLGVATIVVTWVVTRPATNDLVSRKGSPPYGPLAIAFTVVLAIGLVEVIWSRLAPMAAAIAARLLSGDDAPARSRRLSLAAIVCLAGLFASGLIVFSRHPAITRAGSERPPTSGRRLQTIATFELPAAPLALTFRDATTGYIALASGELLHFSLPRGSNELSWARVARGLGQVRGVAVLDDQLFVTEIVSWPCPDSPTQRPGPAFCTRQTLEELEDDEAEAKILTESRGRISRFSVNDDGSLEARSTLFDDLPVVSSIHAPNGLVAGADGRLYASIGNVDGLWDAPDVLATVRHPNRELLGTIVRFEPDGGELEVFATGLRNLYGLTMDDDGNLFGVDNDGPTPGGYRGEELLRLEEGENYGYPQEGSRHPFEVRTRGPMWILDAFGTAGIEWAPRAGLRSGLIIGSFERLFYITVRTRGDDVRVTSKPVALEVSSEYRAIVKAVGDGRLLVGGPGPLRLVRLPG